MGLKIEFAIYVEGIMPYDFAQWLGYSGESGAHNTIRTDNKMVFLHLKHIVPYEDQPYHSIEIFLQDTSEAERSSKETYDSEIEYEINGFQKEYPDIDIQSWDWEMVPIGRVKILPAGSGIEAVCESDGEYSAEIKYVADWIMNAYGDRAKKAI